MALSKAQLKELIADLTRQYQQLSREYSEIADEQRREEITATMASIDYQLARLEEQWQELGHTGAQAMTSG